MDWSRRRLIQLVGVAGVSGVAGCSGIRSDPKTDSQPEKDTPSLTDSASSTPTPTTTLTPSDTAQPKQPGKFAAADGDAEDEFGSSAAISNDGTTALIGAPGDEDPNGPLGGSAYVFEASGGSWTQQAKLAAADGNKGDKFGESVAVSSDGATALVGAPWDNTPNQGEYSGEGSAYVFEASGGSWTQQAKLAAADSDKNDKFGFSVAVSSDGTTALIGAWSDEDPNGREAGSAYVFEGSGGSWSQQAKLAAADGDKVDSFGLSVAVSSDGTTALIGAPDDEGRDVPGAGSAYVFEGSGGSWSQQAKLAAADAGEDDSFGSSVEVSSDGTTALVSASQDRSAYVFNRSGGSWTQLAKLAPNDESDRFEAFGRSVAVSNDGTTALIGTPADYQPNGSKVGSAYVFEGSGGSWSQQAKLAAANGDKRDYFGDSVAVSSDGTTALIGALGDEDPNGKYAGSAYVFNL